jgi:hypothetical protein
MFAPQWLCIANDVDLQPALVTYVTAGFPTPAETVEVLLGMEAGGAGKDLNCTLLSIC